jgi:5-formyltetrahydrofolate cyclo-ligase
MTLPAAKAEWRARLLRQRRARPAADRHVAQSALTDHLLDALAALGGGARLTVCLYLPLPSEPLAPDAPFLVAQRGHRVLVPVTTTGAPLDWCELPGDVDFLDGSAHGRTRRTVPSAPEAARDAVLLPGPLGVAEPAGPRLGPDAVLNAAVIVVPALATDPAGFRLGRGGGFYDRTLALLPQPTPGPQQSGGAGSQPGGVMPVAPRIAVLFDGEADLPIPHEAHDARVSHVLTPALGLRELP